MKERDIYENFENYLKGKFDAEQKADFEKQLATNGDLLKQFEDYKEAHQLIFDSSLLDIKKHLSDINNKALFHQRIWQNVKYTIYGVSVIITAFIIYWALHKNAATEKQPTNITQPIITPKDTFIKTDSLKKNTPPSPTHDKKPQVKKQEVFENTKKADTLLNKSNSDINKKPIPTKIIDSAQIIPSKTEKKNISNIKGSKDQKPEDNKIDCSKLKISCNYSVDDACIGLSKGKIIFKQQSIKGGKAPYMFSINNGATFTYSNTFDDVSKGPYTLIIKDVNDCSTNLGIANVKEIACENYETDFVIAPERGEVWKIPFDKDKTGKLYIYTKAGNLVYTSDLGPYSSLTWDGKAMNGQLLPLSVYAFRIVYSDGEFLNGTVTIIK